MDDLKLIKKHYGEKMMHLCRESFPETLDHEGLLFSLISKTFAYSKYLYDDLKKGNNTEIFKTTITSLLKEEGMEDIDTGKTPKELLDEAGYDFYECHTEEDIQKFKKYYAKGEELCTFNGRRLYRCHVFWAVKKDVDSIKRGKIPKREDSYGTSVISIQFTRDSFNFLSIKNRYNHTLKEENPDATFNNRLETIIPGLKTAFEKTYNLNLSNLPKSNTINGYITANDGKFYKYNYEKNNIYYCPNNIIIDNNVVKRFDKSKYLVIDNYIIDLQNKKIELYDKTINDSFLDGLNNIDKIEIRVDKETKNRTVTINNDIIIVLDKYNRIIKYKNNHIKVIRDNFLNINTVLEEINTPNVEYIGNDFLPNNTALAKIDFPNVLEIEDNFIPKNIIIKNVSLPKVYKIGNRFMIKNIFLTKLNLSNLIYLGDHFLEENKVLYEIDIHNIENLGNNCLLCNENIRNFDISKAIKVGNNLLGSNMSVDNLKVDSLKEIGDFYFTTNKYAKETIKEKIEINNTKYR